MPCAPTLCSRWALKKSSLLLLSTIHNLQPAKMTKQGLEVEEDSCLEQKIWLVYFFILYFYFFIIMIHWIFPNIIAKIHWTFPGIIITTESVSWRNGVSGPWLVFPVIHFLSEEKAKISSLGMFTNIPPPPPLQTIYVCTQTLRINSI